MMENLVIFLKKYQFIIVWGFAALFIGKEVVKIAQVYQAKNQYLSNDTIERRKFAKQPDSIRAKVLKQIHQEARDKLDDRQNK